MIQVDVSHSNLKFIDAFSIYERLVYRFGSENIFILESLSGPDADGSSSIIGINQLFRIEVRDHDLRVSGKSKTANYVREEISKSQILDTGRLRNKKDVWNVLKFIQGLFRLNLNNDHPQGGFSFGYFGYFGYDTVSYIEEIDHTIPRDTDQPSISLAVYQSVIHINPIVNKTNVLTSTESIFWDSLAVDEFIADIDVLDDESLKCSSASAFTIENSMEYSEFENVVKKALEHIRCGDIYQIQLGYSRAIKSDIEPLNVYKRLRFRSPSPYMYSFKLGGYSFLGASPEVFFRLEGRKVTMRALAGTIARFEDPKENALAKQKLLSNEKELAEHVMLVDLCRNDIGRVCLPGTLDVTEFSVIEEYSHVSHLVSNIIGQLPEGVDQYDVIKATFPAGTMTGTPKVRAVQIIEALEKTERHSYAGAIGLLDFSNGYTNLALCIRSAVHNNDTFHIRASAGIVADSIAKDEWNEISLKMGACMWAITGKDKV